MISLPLLKKELKGNYKILLIFMIIITLYVPIVVFLYDPEMAKMLKEFEEALPGVMAAFGMVLSGSDLISFLNSYLFGFILLVFPMVFSIMLSNKLVVGYVDSGSMACLLATPNKRSKIITTQIAVTVINISILIIYSAIISIIAGEVLFPGELNIKGYILMNVGLLALHLAIGGITFMASCIFNETKNSYLVGAGIPIVFYLLKMLSSITDQLSSLKYFTIFTLLPADRMAAGETDVAAPILILAAIAIVLYSLGAYIFTKKDLPI